LVNYFPNVLGVLVIEAGFIASLGNLFIIEFLNSVCVKIKIDNCQKMLDSVLFKKQK